MAIDSNKRRLMESIKQKVESVTAMTKALINEEAAERAKNFEYLLKYVNNKTEEFEKKMRVMLDFKISEITAKMNNFIQEMERKMMEFQLWTRKELETLDEKILDFQIE